MSHDANKVVKCCKGGRVVDETKYLSLNILSDVTTSEKNKSVDIKSGVG